MVLVVTGLKLPIEIGGLRTKVRRRGARSWENATIARTERRKRKRRRLEKEVYKPWDTSLNAGLTETVNGDDDRYLVGKSGGEGNGQVSCICVVYDGGM
jgi:hypothetical protein